MKTIILALSLVSLSAQALEVQFVGPCSARPLLSVVTEVTGGQSVGALTLWTLDQHQIPYLGTEAGINQAFDTPIGMEAMEVISDKEMLAYGWCFEIDGQIPEVYPHELKVTNDMKVIRWFYGYAHYLNGEWVAQCLKSHLRKPKQMCD